MSASHLDAALEDAGLVYVTTTGRVTRRPHEIEIWFAANGSTLYLLSGGGDRSDWVRNLLADPRVSVRLAEAALSGSARVVEDPHEARRARDLVFAKYQPRYAGDLTRWRERSLPVAIDLDLAE